jgi:hypothetical protein
MKMFALTIPLLLAASPVAAQQQQALGAGAMAHELMPLGQSACAGVVRSKARRIRRVMVSPW